MASRELTHLRPRHIRYSNDRRVDLAGPDLAWQEVFTELEQAFFAAAPPDDPEPPGEPERFDDLD